MGVEIRKASKEDIDLLYEIEVECFGDYAFSKPQLKCCLSSPNFLTLAVLAEEKPVGFLIGSMERLNQESMGHIYTLDVKFEFRRKGLGTKLLATFEQTLAQSSVKTFCLEVSINNTAAKKLYLKAGYKVHERLKDYYESGIDGIRLRKNI